jgi:hypothetical protein
MSGESTAVHERRHSERRDAAQTDESEPPEANRPSHEGVADQLDVIFYLYHWN